MTNALSQLLSLRRDGSRLRSVRFRTNGIRLFDRLRFCSATDDYSVCFEELAAATSVAVSETIDAVDIVAPSVRVWDIDCCAAC